MIEDMKKKLYEKKLLGKKIKNMIIADKGEKGISGIAFRNSKKTKNHSKNFCPKAMTQRQSKLRVMLCTTKGVVKLREKETR